MHRNVELDKLRVGSRCVYIGVVMLFYVFCTVRFDTIM
jgi:hypothetical protein